MAYVNGFYKTPWVIGGGSVTNPEVARNLAHIASRRAEGINGTSDHRVSPLNVPGQGVQIAPGSCVIRSRSSAQSQQSYTAYAEAVSTVDIVPTGSGAGRSDLIILRVEDPFAAGTSWPTPADPTTATYIYPRVIQGVPANATKLSDVPSLSGQSAIVLARIDMPASTGTVTAGMITDLRRQYAPRQEAHTNFNQGATTTRLTYETFGNWPEYAPGWEVPEWATHADCYVTLNNIYALGVADGEMYLQLNLGGQHETPQVKGPTQKYDINSATDDWAAGSSMQRFSMGLGCYGEVHQVRGQILYQQVRAHRLPNRPDRKDILLDQYSNMKFELTFYEKPI